LVLSHQVFRLLSVDISFVPGPSGQDIIVGNYVGLEYIDAQDRALRSGLLLSFADPNHPQAAHWVVVAQNPVVGTEVTRRSEVRVWVQDHPDNSAVDPSDEWPDDRGGPGGGVREPRRPLPGQDDDALALVERTEPQD
jgi:hypothetical protein